MNTVLGSLVARGLRFLWLAVLAVGCDGSDGAEVVSESFLQYCETGCDGDLTCLNGVCTLDCGQDAAICQGLDESASCVTRLGGGLIACDVPCQDVRECAPLGPSHRCTEGYCRLAGPEGEPCRVAHQLYASGSEHIPPPQGCGDCRCDDGALTCEAAECPGGAPVIECPASVYSDIYFVDRWLLSGALLTVEVNHAGGCARHDYALCYSPSALESTSGDVELSLIHDAHQDGCEAALSAAPRFDLTPLGVAYAEAQQDEGPVIPTNFGLYGYGALTCEERQRVAAEQTAAAVLEAPTGCQQRRDCQRVSIDTRCNAACGAIVSDLQLLSAALERIDSDICGAPSEPCSPLIPPCVPPLPLDCVANRCVEVMP